MDPSLNGYSHAQASQLYTACRADPAARRPRRVDGGQPAAHAKSGWRPSVDGYKAKEGEDINPHINTISPGYFRTMGIPLVAGREFTEADGATAPRVAIISEAMAHYFFGQNPVGRRFGFGRGKATDIEIIGVVKDGKEMDLRKEAARFYIPFDQDTDLGRMRFFVRTRPPGPSLGTRSAASSAGSMPPSPCST